MGVVVICLTVTQTNGTGISDNVSSQSPDTRDEYSDLRTYVCTYVHRYPNAFGSFSQKKLS